MALRQRRGNRFVTSRSDRTISVLGPDLTVNGGLISKGELRVDGEVQGDIRGVRVVIGETARVTGGVVAEDVIILGHVMGSVRGLRVSLQSASHVEGTSTIRLSSWSKVPSSKADRGAQITRWPTRSRQKSPR